MSLLSTPAIVLGSMRLGEADKLITFFTVKRGKLKGVAQGARRMKSRFGASLEPFTHCTLIIFEKGGEKLARINQTDILHSFQPLREDWSSIESASRMADLTMHMTPDSEPNPEIFNLLLQGLTFLEGKKDPVLTLILFINRLIMHSGYQCRWDTCLKCQHLFKAGVRQTLYFSPSAGGTLCAACAKNTTTLTPLSQSTRAFLSATQKMDYIQSHRFRPSSDMLKECETLFRQYLAHITGKPIQRFSPQPTSALHL